LPITSAFDFELSYNSARPISRAKEYIIEINLFLRKTLQDTRKLFNMTTAPTTNDDSGKADELLFLYGEIDGRLFTNVEQCQQS